MALSRAERCLALLLRLLSRACLALLGLVAPAPPGARPAPPRAVPPPRRPLLLLPARQLAARLRARQVTCIEVVETYVERIKEVNPLINAVVKDRFEEALQEARQVDKLLSEGAGDDYLEEKFPLLGVPITVKEAFSLHGMPNTSGLVNRRNVIATSDATVVSRLKQAGAIPLGVTNCSELCMWYESSNRVYGRTNNPYDLQRIVGGSSGGEGGVLAAACSVIGVGSDIGGSIRMPAFFNGVFGHKPTTGVVPNDGQFPNARGVRTSFLCTGPMCRYAEDLELMLRVMAGPGVSRLKLNEKVLLEKIKFHCMDHDGGSIFVSPVDKEILQAQKKVVEHLESELGVQVRRVAIHKMKYSFQIWSAMMSSKDSDGQVPAARRVCEWQNSSSTPILSPLHPAWQRRAGGRWTGCSGMSPALTLLLSLASCTLLRGMPLPPRDVRLEAQNFHVRLRWQPDPGSPSGASYQVEWRRRTSRWTKVDTCWGNSTSSSWACELYFDKIHDIYWARVRAVAGGKLSEWAYSSELQLYRDTIVGPPKLSWLLQGHILNVNIIMPLTPYRSTNGSYKPVDQVLLKLWYWLNLYEGDVLVQQVPCKWSREEAPCTFRYLKPSTQYCVRTAAAGMVGEQSQEAEQCMVTPAGRAGSPEQGPECDHQGAHP
ncbi:fatty-acid amide hydrolase 2 isoform 4-T4 [Morphnus guianensis]